MKLDAAIEKALFAGQISRDEATVIQKMRDAEARETSLEGRAEAALQRLAEKDATATGISVEKAYTRVLETAAGAELYAVSRGGMPSGRVDLTSHLGEGA